MQGVSGSSPLASTIEKPLQPLCCKGFSCFWKLWPARDWRAKSRFVLPDVAEISLSGCMELYGFFRCPKGFRRQGPSRGCTPGLMRPLHHLNHLGGYLLFQQRRGESYSVAMDRSVGLPSACKKTWERRSRGQSFSFLCRCSS